MALYYLFLFFLYLAFITNAGYIFDTFAPFYLALYRKIDTLDGIGCY